MILSQVIGSLGSTRIVIGLSAIVAIHPGAGNQSFIQKTVTSSAGGTLEVVPIPIALSGSSALGWGLGYPVAPSETISANGPIVYYLAATGVTQTIALMFGQSQGGATLI